MHENLKTSMSSTSTCEQKPFKNLGK